MRTGRALIVSIVLSGLGVSACGSSSSVATSTTLATASGAAAAATGGTGGATPDSGGNTPAGGTGTGSSTRGAAYKVYTDCMAANGVTLPARTPRANGATTPGSGPVSTDPGAGATPGPGGNGGGNGGFGGGFRPGGLTAPTGVDQAKYTAAAAVCKDKLPTGGFGGGGGGGAGGRLNNPAYVACMKDNGIVLPTPTSTTLAGAATDSTPSTAPASTSTVVPPSTIDRTSAAYVAANAKCKVLLPNRGAGTAGGTGSTTTVAG